MGDDSSITRRGFLRNAATVAGGAIVAACPWPRVEAQTRATKSSRLPTVYSWRNMNLPGFIPMQWRQAGGKAVFGGAMMLVEPIPGAFNGPLDQVIAQGPDIKQAQQRMSDYFKWIKHPPKWIVLDDESDGFGYWQISRKVPLGSERAVIFESVWRNKAAYAKLPDELKQFTPDDFHHKAARRRQAIIAWENFAATFKADALRQAVYEPAVAVFGESVCCGNYGDLDYDFPIDDIDNWPLRNAMMGNWSCPSCYLWNRGHRYDHQSKDVLWNSFIDALNQVRSCLNRSNRVAPWVSHPSFHEKEHPFDLSRLRWLWVELLEQIKMSDIQTFLYWSPGSMSLPPDDDLARRVLLQVVDKPAVGPFKAIPLNADEVRTGDKVTKYEQWLATAH